VGLAIAESVNWLEFLTAVQLDPFFPDGLIILSSVLSGFLAAIACCVLMVVTLRRKTPPVSRLVRVVNNCGIFSCCHSKDIRRWLGDCWIPLIKP